MTLSKNEYFFYEWLIIEKQITEEKFKQLTSLDFNNLKNEYNTFISKIK